MEHLPQESFRNYFQEGVPCPLPCVGMGGERHTHMPTQSRGHDTLAIGFQLRSQSNRMLASFVVPCISHCFIGQVPQEETNPRDRTDNANNQVFSTESGGPVIDEISGKQRPDRGCDEEKNSGKCRF